MSKRILTILMVTVLAGGTALARGMSLPERAFLVEGGAVAVAAFVDVDPQRQILFGKIPTRYAVMVTNETADAIWIDWEIKIKKKFKKVKSDGIQPARRYRMWFTAVGIVEEAPVPMRFTVYSDEDRDVVIGREETVMYFEKDDVATFKEIARSGGGSLVVGWREMGLGAIKEFETSRGDAEVQKDIQFALWKEESKYRRDCEHTAVAATPMSVEGSAALAAVSEDTRGRASALNDSGRLSIELWEVKSCETVTPYEVVLAESSRGGIDILTIKQDQAGEWVRGVTGFVAMASFAAEAAALEGAASLEDYKGQFSLDVPEGWYVRDQSPVNENGVIVFAAEDLSRIALDQNNTKKQARALQRRIDSGELPNFFVDRRPSEEGASCGGFSETAVERLLDFYKTMPGLGEDSRIVEGPTATQVVIGGCEGLKVTLRLRTGEKQQQLMMLIEAVSDGTTHYDFALRSDVEHFESNKHVFESTLATLRLSRADGSSEQHTGGFDK